MLLILHYSFCLLAPQELKLKSAVPAPIQALGPMTSGLLILLISLFTVEEEGEEQQRIFFPEVFTCYL